MGTLSTSKRILVTGASRGIGRAAALALAEQGHTVALAARDEGALRQLAGEIARAGGRAEVVPMDVTDDASVERGIARLLEAGPCDIVINNAGSCDQADFLVQRMETQRSEMDLNYWGAVRVTRALLPSMLLRRSGVVVNVSSMLGIVASPTTANYSATKAALNAWSHALRGEVGRFGIQVVVFVAPHTDTASGRRVRFEGVVSLPVAYTVEALLRAVDRAPRQAAASPVYRLLLRLAGLFPAFIESRVAASARPHLLPSYEAAPGEGA
ncbi:SDR family NAD(P)-dependent oxidoreductase [Sorangium sp. So ce726]|uniref:SDR family NAD(P)-dependent oxidoreductase n=1 Tax=Sorangium sp. So ce726 TaxID=3133319 RepID=UPI003F5D8F3A